MFKNQVPTTKRVSPLSPYLPGLALALVIAMGALLLRQFSGIAVLSPMLVAVLAGLVVRITFGTGKIPNAGIKFASRSVLRLGIVLLGLQITLAQIAGWGFSVFLIAALSLIATYFAMMAVAPILGVPKPLAQLISAGTAVCGASAVVAANSVAQGDEEDVGYAIASITFFGTLAIPVLPVLAQLLELAPNAYGVWVGATVHEVAQVTAAAFQMGPEAGEAGTVTKLVRVMLLAPMVMAMAVSARGVVDGKASASAVAFPWFVLAFLALVVVNSFFSFPTAVTTASSILATFLMSAGLAAMGLAIDLRQLRMRGFKPLLLGALGWVFITGFALVLVKALL